MLAFTMVHNFSKIKCRKRKCIPYLLLQRNEKIAEHVFHFVNGRCWFFKEIRSTKSNLILLYAMSSFLQPAPGSQIVGKSRKQDRGKIGHA